MSDWLKILISTLAGFSAAIVAEPLKAVITDVIKRRHLRRALYIELSANIGSLAHYGFRRDGESMYFYALSEWGAVTRRDAFEHALKQPDVFLRVRDAFTIRMVYELIHGLREDGDYSINDLLRIVVKSMRAGDLDIKHIHKLAPKNSQDDLRALPAKADKAEQERGANAPLGME